MINDINHLLIVGTLGEDAKLAKTKNQEPMTILNVVTGSDWFDGTTKKSKTLWNKIFFFGDQAKACEPYKKGMKVHITAEVAEKLISEGDYRTIITGVHVWVVDLGSNNRPSSEPPFAEHPF